jgi:hypothetical protein
MDSFPLVMRRSGVRFPEAAPNVSGAVSAPGYRPVRAKCRLKRTAARQEAHNPGTVGSRPAQQPVGDGGYWKEGSAALAPITLLLPVRR